MKKIVKGLGIFILVIIIALIATPFIFKDKIKTIVLKTINENVDATVAFNEVDLSLLKNFPKASITIDNLNIVNKAPFENDTLFNADNFILKMSIKELFKGNEDPISIESFSSENAKVAIIFNKDGVANYDIALKNDTENNTSENSSFEVNFQNYTIKNLQFIYLDESTNTKVILDSIYHEGSGDFKNQLLDLDTKTTANLSFEMDNKSYLKNIALSLDAVLGLDLENSIYTFKENKALINQLPLEFDGFIKLMDAGQQYNLSFKTATSSFKNFLGLVPETYSGNLNQVKTTGDFMVNGTVNGNLTETTIPKFDVEITSNNASFQYPDLPKSVKNILINTRIINQTGIVKDTYVNLDKLSFTIDEDVFNAKATIKNITENALVNAELKGVVNLANITKAYPVKLEKPLSGILKANAITSFDMNSVEKSQYQNIKNSGSISLTDFNYEGPEMAKLFKINQAEIVFNPTQINLKQFNAETGSSDLKVTGVLDNFYGFLFKDQVLKGNFNLNSNKFVVSDFMTTTAADTTTVATSEALKIPSFLDCSLTAKATTVVYDNLNLKGVSGNLTIKDESVLLNNLNMSAFGGKISLNGKVSTKEATPKFEMDLGLDAVNIAESFTQLDMLKSIAPIANTILGKLNSTIKLSGNLTNEMTPDLKTLSGDLLGQLLNPELKTSNSKLLSALSSNVNFIDLEKLNLDNLKMALSFENGQVQLKPFTIKHQDITAEIGGTHGFDQSMNYTLKFDVPAKYLGTEATNLLAKLTPSDASKIESIPVNANLTGSFLNPKVSTDLKQATTNLASQLIEMQKGELINKGTDALTNVLNNVKSKDTVNKTTTDTIKTSTKETDKSKDSIVKNALKNLFKRKE
ncbi:AsmA-like C-terminal region-containing protein [Lutibacter sp. A64]|uniref:AsmA-like C-terminal region-containing protein n=1 Tax=Lutibacter sp. A64 TaxID=2918526 RepID=UPI0035304A83